MKSLENARSPFFEVYYFLFVSLCALIYTYPLITDFSGMFFGAPGDSLSAIWSLWWDKFSYLNNIPLRRYTYLAYPFGYDNSNVPFGYLLHFMGFSLTFITNEVVSYNLLKLMNFPLLALTTYILIHYLTDDRIISALAGIVCSFSPFHVVHSMAHFANIYWIPLTILFLIRLLREGGYKNAVLFGLFWGFAFVDNVYYAYFVGLFLPVFVSVFLLDSEKRSEILKCNFLKFTLVSLFTFCLVVFPMMYPMLKALFFTHGKQPLVRGIVRSFSDLFIFSARPLDYLMPSKYNPFLGWLVPDLGIGALKGHRYTEHTLYLGYSLIFLGGYAFYCALRKVGQLGENKGDRHTVYLFFTVALVAAILSAPPFIPLGDYQVDFQTREVIANHKLYLPQYFLYKLFPMFRVYARMGAIVLLAVCVLAAFGLRETLSRINTQKGRYLFLSLFFLVVFIEYAEFPPFRLTEAKEPEVYKWLALQPGSFSIVEYPLGAGDDPYTTYEYYFYQRIHKKYLVNGAIEGTPADKFRKEVIDISKDETIDKLSKIGVRYILIHKDKYVKGNETVPLDWLTQPPRDKLFPVEYNDGKIPNLPIKRLRLIKDFGDTAVYEIVQGP